MEFINKIHIRGIIGKADVNTFNSSQVCNFTVVTDYSTVDREGNPGMESTWFNVTAWSGREGIPKDLFAIQRGGWVEVKGRLRLRRYTTQENEERTSVEIIARTVTLLEKDDDRMQPQRS